MKGESVYVDGVEVANVLVEDGLSKDVEKVEQLSGARVDYTLRFPVDATPPSHDSKVTVHNVVLDVLNFPEHWDLKHVFGDSSLPWDMNVLVGKALGDFTAAIEIVSISVTIDALGDAIKTESTVFTGNAQARMKSGGENTGTAIESDVSEVWCFIVPWDIRFTALRASSTFIDYAAARYDVRKIEAMENKQEYVLFEAVLLPGYQESGETGETGVTGNG